MLELAEKITNHLQSGHIIVLVAAFALSLAHRYFPLLNAYHEHRKRRVTELENIIKSRHISPQFKKNLKEEIECEHFKCVYGVRARKSLIDQVFMLHEIINGERTLNQFANALKLYPKVIQTHDSSYRLKVGLLDYFFGFYHLFFGLLFLVVGAITLTYQIDRGLFALGGRPLILSLVVIVGGLFMLYMSTSIYSLMLINRTLKTRT
jgi:hypothetical protein